MSANDHTTAHEEANTGPIKTPQQLLAAVFFSFVVPIFAIIGLVYYVNSANKPEAGSDNSERAVAQRIQKVGVVEIAAGTAPAAEATAPAAAMAPAPAATTAAAAAPVAAASGNGEALYKQTCVACHGSGVAGAPKFGDKAAWAPRIQTGIKALYASATNGKNAMPPRGGSSASDADLHAAVDYMVNAAK